MEEPEDPGLLPALKPASAVSAEVAGEPLRVMTLNANKAGMVGLDTDKINRIIAEASKGSKFYEAKAKNQLRIDAQVEAMKAKLAATAGGGGGGASAAVRGCLDEEVLDLSRTIVHVDMDAFYAAVHERDRPELKEVAMAVGSLGMLSTSNYVARKFGVRAAMPGFIARKLCPDLVIIPLDFAKYREAASKVRAVFAQYDPNFAAGSLDEAYLDLTDYLGRTDGTSSSSEEDVVREIRSKITEATGGLTASAGIAPNTLLAKVASDQNKPNGQFRIGGTRDAVAAFVRNLPVRKVPGIGGVTEQLLSRVLGVRTCGDLQAKLGQASLIFSPATFRFLCRASSGIGSNRLSDPDDDSGRKSIGNETTFAATADPAELKDICDQLCQELFEDLIKEDLKGKQVTVKIKTHRFENRSKVANLAKRSDNLKDIQEAARRALRSLMEAADEKPLKLRLMGVRMAGFEDESSSALKKPSAGQTTLDSFLKGNASGKAGSKEVWTFYPCPICNRQVAASDEDGFNGHLDECMSRAGDGPDDGPDPASTEAQQPPPRTTESCFTCPVCGKDISVAADVAAEMDRVTNQHVDECLNSAAIIDLKDDHGGPAGEASSSLLAGRLPKRNRAEEDLRGVQGAKRQRAQSSILQYVRHHGTCS